MLPKANSATISASARRGRTGREAAARHPHDIVVVLGRSASPGYRENRNRRPGKSAPGQRRRGLRYILQAEARAPPAVTGGFAASIAEGGRRYFADLDGPCGGRSRAA